MEENRNEQPRTYGEESKMYEQSGYGQPANNGPKDVNQQGGDSNQQPGGYNQNGNYSQPDYSQNGNYGQPDYSQNGNYGQPDYSQSSNYGQPDYNQNGYNQAGGYGQPNYGQPNYNQQNGGYNQQSYYNQPYNQNNYNNYNNYNQPQHSPVTNIFNYILMIILPLNIILGMIMTGDMLSSMTYDSLMDGSYVYDMMGGSYAALSGISTLLSLAALIFFIVDIVMVHKGNYKITGLILFVIFLKPGYFIWRAHILGRKKVVPIIYTVAYVLLNIVYFIYVFFMAYSMVLNMTYYMY